MAQRSAARKPAKESKKSRPFIPEKFQTAAYCLGILLAVFVFLGPATFGGGSFNASDNVASHSFDPYLEKAKEDGEFALWVPYVFSGMPGYGALMVTGNRWWDFTNEMRHAVESFFTALFGGDAARIALYYALYGIGMFLLMLSRGHERYVGLFTALAAVFSTFVIVWIMIGHNTKPLALMTFPYIFLCLDKLRERMSLLYFALLTIAVHVLVESTHIQMVYYAIIAFSLYLTVEIIHSLVKKTNMSGILRSVGLLAAAGAIAFAMGADRYLSVLEYSPHSTRSTAPIQQTENLQQGDNDEADYEYATNWSFSPEEVITFFIPNYFGFGRREYQGPATGNQPVRAPTYWGQMPFTDAANYMGIGVLLLALVGVWRYRGQVFIQFLVLLGLFALILSFGRNLPILYDPFFYFVPFFDKFRAPSMVLVLLQFAVPILAGYGIKGLMEMRQKSTPRQTKILLYGVIGCGVFLVLGLLYSAMGKAGYMEALSTARATQNYPADIKNFIYSEMISDWYATAFLAIAFAALGYFYVRKKVSTNLFAVAVIGLLIIDLWRVDYRAMDVSDQALQNTVLRKTDVAQFLQNDASLFRIADFSSPSNTWAYHFQQHVHGYSAAKLRVYQDLLDVAGGGGGSLIANPFLWDLMNVKYLLSDRELGAGATPTFQSRENGMLVYANPRALPRAFFVQRYEVAEQIEILHHLRDGDFDPQDVAFLEAPITETIEAPGSTASVAVANFGNHSITLDVQATGTNLLFISEVYYPGWRAYLDGEEIPIHKANYAFRAVVVPAGKHTLELKFESAQFELGKTLSLISNILAIGLLGIGIWFARKKSDTSSDSSAT